MLFLFSVIVPWYLKLSWLFHTVAMGNSLVLTVCYWLFLNNGDFHDTNFHNNTVLTFLLLFDHMIIKHPTRIAHLIYCMTFYTVYIISVTIFCIKGVHHKSGCVYPVLNWNNPYFTTAGVTLIGCTFYPTAHTLNFLLYRLRIYIWQRYDQPD